MNATKPFVIPFVPSFVRALWSDLVIASYAVPDQALQSLLPAGLELDHWQGHAYISLVAFRFRRVRVQRLVALAPFGDFPQWNLRFYVKPKKGTLRPRKYPTLRDQADLDQPSDGERGIVFSL